MPRGDKWSAALTSVFFTVGLFAGLPLVDYLCFRHNHPHEVYILERSEIVTPPPPPPPKEKKENVKRDLPKPKLIQPRRLIPLNAVLKMDMTLGKMVGDFTMPFDVAAPDLIDQENYVFEIEEIDQPPQPIVRISPSYPPKAKLRRIEGEVHLEFVVGEDGAVRSPMVVQSDPPGLFDQAALRAVERWRFQPGIKRGSPVPVRVRQRLQFSLEK